jgi:hypothetical protein
MLDLGRHKEARKGSGLDQTRFIVSLELEGQFVEFTKLGTFKAKT